MVKLVRFLFGTATFFGVMGVSAVVFADPSDEDKALVSRVAEKFFRVAPPVKGWDWPPKVGILDTAQVNAFASVIGPGDEPETLEYNGERNRVVWLDVPFERPQSSDADESDGDESPEGEATSKKPSDTSESPDADGGDDRRYQPIVVILQGYLDEIVKGDEINLAETFGHELGHVVRKHPLSYAAGATKLVQLANTREKEREADIEGMRLTLEAGYSYNDVVKGMLASLKDQDYSTYEALLKTHPGKLDRASWIDKNRSKLWSSISAFRNGVHFLLFENYPLAERCFLQVVNDEPGCYEAWANLGHARLMRYCDGLRPEDVAELDLNQLAIAGFYHRPDSLTRGAGPDVPLWFSAVGALHEALRLKPDLVLAKANLALAHLASPEGKNVGQAAELYDDIRKALAKEELEDSLQPLDRAALLINAAIIQRMNGDSKTADEFLARASKIVGDQSLPPPAASAILYDAAIALAESEDKETRRSAISKFEEYLTAANPSVIWWDLAYKRYADLCAEQEAEGRPLPKDKLSRPSSTRFRRVLGVSLDPERRLNVLDSVSPLIESLGEGRKLDVVRRTNIHRRIYDSHGAELICTDRVLAIRLKGDKAPPLVLQSSGPGGESREVKVGMSFAEVRKLLGEDVALTKRYGAASGIDYEYFIDLGFGVRIEGDTDPVVAEIIIGHLPAG